ncbi:MAG: 23S rRNA (pseudouridine(1915)-N(3))-methyltransferase RlmH [Pseudomonadota bacterium]
MSHLPHIDIIAVGKLKNSSHVYPAFTEYQNRLNPSVKIHEVIGHNQSDELKKISQKIDPKSFIIALDETGKTLSSSQFAKEIETIQSTHTKIQFIIGGADGLDDAIRQNAHLLLSFGKQTWPHMMVRVMLIEQIYRTQQILTGHPYHRE